MLEDAVDSGLSSENSQANSKSTTDFSHASLLPTSMTDDPRRSYASPGPSSPTFSNRFAQSCPPRRRNMSANQRAGHYSGYRGCSGNTDQQRVLESLLQSLRQTSLSKGSLTAPVVNTQQLQTQRAWLPTPHPYYWSDSEVANYESLSPQYSLPQPTQQSNLSTVARAAFEAAKAMVTLQNSSGYANSEADRFAQHQAHGLLQARHRQTVPCGLPSTASDYETYQQIGLARSGFSPSSARQQHVAGVSSWNSEPKVTLGAYATEPSRLGNNDPYQEFRLYQSQRFQPPVICPPFDTGQPACPSQAPGYCSSSLLAFGRRPGGSGNVQASSSLPSGAQFTGLLVVHLIAGSGLASNQVLLRDLYCVLETDSVRKSRSMIRTSTDYFEWNEAFEIDCESTRHLALLLYQWDPKTRHRLCFYGGLDLASTINGISQSGSARSAQRAFLTSPQVQKSGIGLEKVALQLEPRGLLYLEVGFLELARTFARRPALPVPGRGHREPAAAPASQQVVFGISLAELMEREHRANLLARPAALQEFESVNANVPLLIRKCTAEIDRRGLDVAGIYRLSGSVWMKLQLREFFERASATIVNGLANDDANIVANVLSVVDLSSDRVPDIHAITALMKDFLRELPEPLFTNALYPMIHDAIQVTLPGDQRTGAKLMLNILDCLPAMNQEVLLYLLDHFKRVTKRSSINKMNAHNLAMSIAPILLYPSPEAARTLDPATLEPHRMTEIFKYILEIWPDARPPQRFHSQTAPVFDEM